MDYLMPNPLSLYILVEREREREYVWFDNELFFGHILNEPELICLHTVKWFLSIAIEH